MGKVIESETYLSDLQARLKTICESNDIMPPAKFGKKLKEKKHAEKPTVDEENKAALVMQNFWRVRKIQQELQIRGSLCGCYSLSIVKKKQQYGLSRIVYGRHIAEESKNSAIKNPFYSTIHISPDLRYIQALPYLISEFKISFAEQKEFHFTPISKFRTVSY